MSLLLLFFPGTAGLVFTNFGQPPSIMAALTIGSRVVAVGDTAPGIVSATDTAPRITGASVTGSTAVEVNDRPPRITQAD